VFCWSNRLPGPRDGNPPAPRLRQIGRIETAIGLGGTGSGTGARLRGTWGPRPGYPGSGKASLRRHLGTKMLSQQDER
jgi:hypothetical protein